MDGTTGIVLTVIFGLVALILGILNFATKNKESENKKLIKQTEFNVTGKTGGAKTHTLTEAEMPSHNHNTTQIATGSLASSSYAKANQGGTYYNQFSGSKGGDRPHNNLQPYITVYMWKRTE